METGVMIHDKGCHVNPKSSSLLLKKILLLVCLLSLACHRLSPKTYTLSVGTEFKQIASTTVIYEGFDFTFGVLGDNYAKHYSFIENPMRDVTMSVLWLDESKKNHRKTIRISADVFASLPDNGQILLTIRKDGSVAYQVFPH